VDSLVDISAPAGVFTFTGAEANGIVLIAGGVGITPMMSVIRYLIDISFPGEIFFLFGARTTEDFIFREELRASAAATLHRGRNRGRRGPPG
jgi:ferredoxin-NADP reductase